jgi:hypothetical protein
MEMNLLSAIWQGGFCHWQKVEHCIYSSGIIKILTSGGSESMERYAGASECTWRYNISGLQWD